MMVTFDPRARADLDAIYDWIVRENPKAAESVIARIEQRVRRLAASSFAEQGRKSHFGPTRELLVPPYIVVYEARHDGEEIVVVGVIHMSRRR